MSGAGTIQGAFGAIFAFQLSKGRKKRIRSAEPRVFACGGIDQESHLGFWGCVNHG
jgi:hypothetical protein